MGHLTGDGIRHLLGHQRGYCLLVLGYLALVHHLVEVGPQGLERRAEEGDVLSYAPAAIAGTQEPAGGAAHYAAAVEHQLELGLCTHQIVAPFDVAPQGP